MSAKKLTDDECRLRFLLRVRVTDGCHEWLGPRFINSYLGYGRAHFHRYVSTAHRVAWMMFVGEIPKGMFVLHKCDNPLCVNVQHLFLGTHDDNMRDMVQKGRSTSGDKHWVRRMPELAVVAAKKRGIGMRGKWSATKNQKCKLRPVDVAAIRAFPSNARGSGTWLARFYGVEKGTISNIRRGITWT